MNDKLYYLMALGKESEALCLGAHASQASAEAAAMRCLNNRYRLSLVTRAPERLPDEVHSPVAYVEHQEAGWVMTWVLVKVCTA